MASPVSAAQVDKKSLLTQEQRERLAQWTKRYPYPVMGLVEAVRQVQNWFHHVPLEAEVFLAELFRVPGHQVHEVVTFYPYFTTRPAGKYRIAVCRNLACHLAGCGKMLDHLKSRLGVGEGETTEDGLFTFSGVECLGACDHAPALSVNDELLGRATEEALGQMIAEARAGKNFVAPPSVAVPAASNSAPALTANFSQRELHRLEVYRSLGGYSGWERARQMEPADILDWVRKSNLRGLGGAGFPTGMKWLTVSPKKDRNVPHFLVANADESEPGCFKDRVLMERTPHALMEGMLIAGRAIEADALLIFIRGEYARQRRILEQAIAEAKEARLLQGDILLMRGADAYISGCDTALLETMEGKKAWPRQPPPFPTVSGLMGLPTVVNNVETLMMLPAIFNKGWESFAKRGVERSGGTSVFSISGHVKNPGVYEFPMGTPLLEVIAAAGGVREGRKLKAVIPGGTSTPILTAQEALKAKMDFDSLRSLGSFLGAGGVIVLDETADLVEVLFIIERFLSHESCGQCTPCREGSGWVQRILARMLAGRGASGDMDNLLRIGDNITGKVICALGETVGMVARAMITKFPDEFKKYLPQENPRGAKA